MAAAAGCLLCGYELLRSPSATLFQAAYGAESLPAVMVAVPLGTLAMLYLYGWMLSRLGSRRTLAATSLLSGALIGACYLGVRSGWAPATAVLYVLREAYIVLVIEQYWSFLDSTFEEGGAKRWNGAVIGAGSLGAAAGGWLVYRLSEPLGTAALLVFGAVSVVPAALLSDLAYTRCGEPTVRGEKASGLGHLGLSAFRTSPILVWILLLVVWTQVVSTVLGLGFQSHLQREIVELDRQTAYSGRFYSLLAAVAALMQFIGIPVLLARIPVAPAQFAIPVVHAAAAAVFLASPSLRTAGAAFFLFKILDYSVFRATKEILYIPLPFDARYRAKEIIDVFGYRFSKGAASLGVMALQGAGWAATGLYPPMALAASLLWFAFVYPVARLAGRRGKPPAS